GAVSGFFGGGIGGGGGGMRMGSMGGGMRGMGYMVTGTMNRQKAPAQEFLNNRAGSTLNAALYKNSAGDVLPTATPEASAHFMEELVKKSNEDVYAGYVAGNYPEIAENLKDPRAAGFEIKRHLQTLPPEVAYSNWQRAQNQGNLPKEGRSIFYQYARDEVGTNRETVTAIKKGLYVPNLEALDTAPRFAIDTFNTGAVTEKGTVANAKIFAAVKQLGTPENQRDIDHLAEKDFQNASPDSLGKTFSQISGVKMTAKEQRTYGYAMAKVRSVVVMRNPTLANNIAHYTMGDGKDKFSCLMNDEKFTTQAVKDMESQGTSAWFANTLNVKQTEVPSSESLFKTQPTKPTNNGNIPVNNPTLNQVISPKQPKNKPVTLGDMQKRDFEGGERKRW
ncbi:hypothetical protein, partial [Candidatus Bathycorpusculum sp.]|uniref:hypothetical protein n=1 Tax=Candidatus Bathycorpusculum sp. TaxID=2994959 RepID=UPI002818FFD2|nr:hypothetical protein [Candidatus Termitimicrobium sp.]MCL2686890.1 hypothetical protein [Candidatus Termitimicrobium sp.]